MIPETGKEQHTPVPPQIDLRQGANLRQEAVVDPEARYLDGGQPFQALQRLDAQPEVAAQYETGGGQAGLFPHVVSKVPDREGHPTEERRGPAILSVDGVRQEEHRRRKDQPSADRCEGSHDSLHTFGCRSRALRPSIQSSWRARLGRVGQIRCSHVGEAQRRNPRLGVSSLSAWELPGHANRALAPGPVPPY